jgi:hypothetical protein
MSNNPPLLLLMSIARVSLAVKGKFAREIRGARSLRSPLTALAPGLGKLRKRGEMVFITRSATTAMTCCRSLIERIWICMSGPTPENIMLAG